MSAAFGSRRKVRAIGQDDDQNKSTDEQAFQSGSAMKRPSKPKHRSRVSFKPGGTSMADEEEEAAIVIPKRGLLRRDVEKPSTQTKDLSEGGEPPNYSKTYLEELKKAQISRPDGEVQTQDPPASSEVDVVAKFGKEIAVLKQGVQTSLIPSEAEIREKKARRARLAKMEKYNIDPDASEDSNGQDDRPDSDEDEFLTQRDKISLRDARASSKNEIDTRLVRDDEDLMEGFEDFTGESGRVALGKTSQLEARVRQRAEMQDMINAAQEADEDEDESDQERRDKYEAIQTQKGLESLSVNGRRRGKQNEGPKTPPNITPIPQLSECVQRLREKMLEIELGRKAKLQRLEQLQDEKEEITRRETEIQQLLSETAEKYQKLSAEAVSSKELNGKQENALLTTGTPIAENS